MEIRISLLTMSSSTAGRTRRRLGNTSTCPYYAFRSITKSSSAAERTRRRLGNTSTCPYYVFRHRRLSSVNRTTKTIHRLATERIFSDQFSFSHFLATSCWL